MRTWPQPAAAARTTRAEHERYIMPIRVTCSCGKQYVFKDEYAGRKARCPSCQAVVTITERPAIDTPIQEGKECPGPDRTTLAGGPAPVAIESAIGKLLLGMAQAESKRGAPASFERQCRDENRIVNQWQGSPEESFHMALAIAGDENAEPILRKQARWALALMYRHGPDMDRLASLARNKQLPAGQRQEIVNLMQQVDSKGEHPYLTEILQNPKFSELHAPVRQRATLKENATGAFALCLCGFGVLGLLGGGIGGWVVWVQSKGAFTLLLIPVIAIGAGIAGCVVGAIVGGVIAMVVALVCSLRRGSSEEKPDK